MERPSSTRSAILVMAVLVVIWGYAWVAAKIALAYSGPFDFAALRVAVGVVGLGCLTAVSGRSLRPAHLGLAVLIGVVQTAAFLILNTWALVDGGPGKTSILTFTMPFWVLLFAWPFLGERIEGVQWGAVALAAAGLVSILEPWRSQTTLLSKCLAVGAGMAWAAGVILAKRHQRRHRVDVLGFTFWQMLIGLVPMGLVAWAVPQRAIEWSWPFVASLGFSGIVATGAGWFLWLYVLQRLPAGTTSLASLGIPVIAAASSALQLGERLRPAELAGMALIGVALGIISWDMSRRQRPPDPAMGQE
ncbi:MAG: DMT family transporter [Burkholderiales bacterium]